MPFTNFTDNKMIDAFHGKATYTAPASIWAALSTTAPTAVGGNITEPVGNGYARVAVPAASWATAANATASNTAVINFPTATGAGWGTITHMVFFDAVTAGNALSYGSLPAAQSIPAGVTPSIAVGAATETLA